MHQPPRPIPIVAMHLNVVMAITTQQHEIRRRVYLSSSGTTHLPGLPMMHIRPRPPAAFTQPLSTLNDQTSLRRRQSTHQRSLHVVAGNRHPHRAHAGNTPSGISMRVEFLPQLKTASGPRNPI